MTNIKFAPATAINLLVSGIMMLAIGAGLAKFFGWFAGLTLGLALSYVFTTLAANLVAPADAVSRSERILSGVFALALFSVTVGLSYSTLYANLFAQSSALGEFQRERLPVQRQLESVVLANAEGTVKALSAWQVDSTMKSSQEGAGGGSCPAKLSLGRRGPIAMWRESEAGIAANLHSELKSNVQSIRGKLDALKNRHATNFVEEMAITDGLNVLIEESEALARGSYIKSAQATLARQLSSEISWPNGEIFQCGDTQRDELIKRAQTALNELADVNKNPPLHPLAPAIDLSNQQELTIRGLLRSGNALLGLLTFGLMGSFADDPLMLAALKSFGLVNRETIGFFMAALIEISVIFTSFIAVRSGQAPFPFQPTVILADLKSRADQESNFLKKLLMLLLLGLFKLLVNLFFSKEGVSFSGAVTPVHADQLRRVPEFPSRELNWGRLLTPYMIANHDGDYLVIPNIPNCAKPLTAAGSLRFQGAAVLLSLTVPWSAVADYQPVVSHFGHLVDAQNLSYAIYKLSPDFAQAMRLQILQDLTPSTAATFEGSAIKQQ